MLSEGTPSENSAYVLQQKARSFHLRIGMCTRCCLCCVSSMQLNNTKNTQYFGEEYHLKYRFCSALACGLVIDYIRAQNRPSRLTRGDV
jgi:hypothetical protein